MLLRSADTDLSFHVIFDTETAPVDLSLAVAYRSLIPITSPLHYNSPISCCGVNTRDAM